MEIKCNLKSFRITNFKVNLYFKGFLMNKLAPDRHVLILKYVNAVQKIYMCMSLLLFTPIHRKPSHLHSIDLRTEGERSY